MAAPDSSPADAARERVHDWVVAARREDYTTPEPWTARALRGTVVRSAALAPLAALLGLARSLPQALFTVGISTGLVAAVTFGERWLTRRGVVDWTTAILGGLGAWIAVILAMALFALQVEADFGELAWQDGPMAASEALLEHSDSRLLSLDGGLLVFGLLALPLGVNLGAYLNSADALEAIVPSFRTNLLISCTASLLLWVLFVWDGAGHATLAALGSAFVLWLYLVVSSMFILLAVHFVEWLEAAVFRDRPVRWPAYVLPGSRLKTWPETQP